MSYVVRKIAVLGHFCFLFSVNSLDETEILFGELFLFILLMFSQCTSLFRKQEISVFEISETAFALFKTTLKPPAFSNFSSFCFLKNKKMKLCQTNFLPRATTLMKKNMDVAGYDRMGSLASYECTGHHYILCRLPLQSSLNGNEICVLISLFLWSKMTT